MKKIFTLLFFAGYSGLFAQSFSISATDTTITGLPSDHEIEAQLIIMNNTAADLNMKWVLIEDSITDGWESSVCDPVNCHPDGVDSMTFTLKKDLTDQIMNAHFGPEGIEGYGKAVIKIFEIGKEDSAIFLTYHASALEPVDTTTDTTTTTGFSTASKLDYSINYDNSTNVINIVGKGHLSYLISVYDITGNKLISKANEKLVSLSYLPRGLYIVRLEAIETNKTINKKIFR